MTTFEMLKRSIESKKKRGSLTEGYISDTKRKMDVFFQNDRINADEYEVLTFMLDN